jgi:hypothetical protein
MVHVGRAADWTRSGINQTLTAPGAISVEPWPWSQRELTMLKRLLARIFAALNPKRPDDGAADLKARITRQLDEK